MRRGLLTAKPFWQTDLSEDKCLTLLLERRTKDDFQLSTLQKSMHLAFNQYHTLTGASNLYQQK